MTADHPSLNFPASVQEKMHARRVSVSDVERVLLTGRLDFTDPDTGRRYLIGSTADRRRFRLVVVPEPDGRYTVVSFHPFAPKTRPPNRRRK